MCRRPLDACECVYSVPCTQVFVFMTGRLTGRGGKGERRRMREVEGKGERGERQGGEG